jgi:hypothetical protein
VGCDAGKPTRECTKLTSPSWHDFLCNTGKLISPDWGIPYAAIHTTCGESNNSCVSSKHERFSSLWSIHRDPGMSAAALATLTTSPADCIKVRPAFGRFQRPVWFLLTTSYNDRRECKCYQKRIRRCEQRYRASTVYAATPLPLHVTRRTVLTLLYARRNVVSKASSPAPPFG